LTDFAWPGNVRQLKGAIERAVFITDSKRELTAAEILAAAQPFANLETPLVVSLKLDDRLDIVEKQALLDARQRHGQNKSRMAKELSVTRPRLERLMKKHHLS
jgi:sigma-54-dependent transcriptional regulator